MKRELEEAIQYNIVMRPDIRIEVGDVLSFDYALSGTGRIMSYMCVVTDLQMRAGLTDTVMNINARDYISGDIS